jgi:hypothetical protein
MSNNLQIDRLGYLLAEIADLEKQAKAIKDALREAGDGAYEGEVFRATVSTSERETLDMAAVREHLSRQFITANTKVTETQTVRVVARNGKAVKEAA